MMQEAIDLDDLDGEVLSEAMGVAKDMERLKDAGSALVKGGKFSEAYEKYGSAIRLANEKAKILSVDFDAERRAEKCVLACYANRALCCLKMKDLEKAKEVCGLGKTLKKNTCLNVCRPGSECEGGAAGLRE